jgi:predicted GIY-YIG superfamily endonuclease
MNYDGAKAAPPKSASDGGGLYPRNFVYVLRSQAYIGRTYTGRTENPEQRLTEHNEGLCPHTSKFKPWRIETLIAFSDIQKAIAFERYLKSGSGRAFSKRHLG